MSALSDIAHKQEICREILSTLPSYGQNHQLLNAQIAAISPLDVFIEFDHDAALGFMAMKAHSPIHIEIYLLAVRRAAQGQGIGSRLMAAANSFGQDHDARYLSVQLQLPATSDRTHAKSTTFFQYHGFEDFMALPDASQSDTVGLLMVKHIHLQQRFTALHRLLRLWRS